MIDTYMDRASWPTWMNTTPSVPVTDDARYFNGAFYATVIDRMVAEAKFELQGQLAFSVAHHKRQIMNGFAQARRTAA